MRKKTLHLKKALRAALLILMLSAASMTQANPIAQIDLDSLMRERNEYYFTLKVDKPTEIQTINEICSVDGFDGNTAVCYANQQQYDRLLQKGYQPKLQTPPCMLEKTAMWDGTNRAAYQWDSYPTYGAYQSMMEAFPASALGDRSCTLLDLGTLNSGRKILGVRLNNGQPDGKPRFLYSSTMHGDEVTGMMLMLRLIDELCTSTDPRILNLLNNLDIFIFPLTNPDGTYYGGNNTMNQARRYNINGVDLNRNYKDYFRGDHPDGNAYALETQWTMQLADEYLFTMSANYHGGAEVVNYPWDAVYQNHIDKDWYEHISMEYVSKARANAYSYMTSPYMTGITNGAEWYVITGSRQDYENAYGECREITIECSSTKKPNASTMPSYWNKNHDAMLALMEQCLNGIHGVVNDAVTHQPIAGANVKVQNHDNDLSQVTTHGAGDFHRPIKGGSYTLEISKTGYHTAYVEVTVADDQRVDLDAVYLIPLSVQQTVQLSVGWNWYSTYIEQEGIDGLGQLENSIGVPKALIQSKDDGYVKSGLRNGMVVWRGALTSVNNEEMYKIGTKVACTATMEGQVTHPADHPITINQGWNWIGYPCSQSMSVSEALAGFTPKNRDVIKGLHSYATYSNGTWSGALSTLEPGQGYMYRSGSSATKTLIFPSGSRGEATLANVTPASNHYQPVDDYADNMTLIAVVDLDSEELRSEGYELAAFAGDECRGSVKLMYVESINRYVAFLTAFGDEAEDLHFVLTDGATSSLSTNRMVYATDAIEGSLDEPVTLHFGTAEVDVMVYPNPSNGVFNIESTNIQRVDVFNALGQPVSTMETASGLTTLDLSNQASGIYLIRIVTADGIKSHQVMKR